MDNCSTDMQLIAGLTFNSSVQHMLEYYCKNENFHGLRWASGPRKLQSQLYTGMLCVTVRSKNIVT